MGTLDQPQMMTGNRKHKSSGAEMDGCSTIHLLSTDGCRTKFSDSSSRSKRKYVTETQNLQSIELGMLSHL